MSTDPGATLPIADEAREAYEAARREHRDLTETERAIAGAEALTPQEALSTVEAADESTPAPPAQAMEEELRDRLRQLIDALPSDAGQLIRAVYYEGVTLTEAGSRLGISKAWASRLHAKTLRRLARALQMIGYG